MYTVAVWLCLAGSAAIFGAMLYSVAAFRGEPGPSLAARRASKPVELLWALVPILIFAVAATPALMNVTAAPAERSASARQWSFSRLPRTAAAVERSTPAPKAEQRLREPGGS